MPPYICQFCGHKSSCKSNYYYHYNTHITPDNINTISKEDIDLCMLYSNKKGLCKMKYYENNKEKIKQMTKEYYQKNKEQLAQYNKAYRQNNKEKLMQSKREYRQNNKDKIKEYQKIYDKEYRQTNGFVIIILLINITIIVIIIRISHLIILIQSQKKNLTYVCYILIKKDLIE